MKTSNTITLRMLALFAVRAVAMHAVTMCIILITSCASKTMYMSGHVPSADRRPTPAYGRVLSADRLV
jgi:hypothetical protein